MNPLSLCPRRRRLLVAVLLASVTGGARAGASAGAPAAIRLEAETGQPAGAVKVATAAAGYSGTGYVTDFLDDGDRVTLTFRAATGLYALAIRYRSPHKGFLVDVNGLTLSGMFADSGGAFVERDYGKVTMRDGENVLAIHGGWKHYEIDRVDLTPVAAPP